MVLFFTNRAKRIEVVLKNTSAPNNKTKGLSTKRKLSNRFIMQPPGKLGAFSLFGFHGYCYPGNGGEGNLPESFIVPGTFVFSY